MVLFGRTAVLGLVVMLLPAVSEAWREYGQGCDNAGCHAFRSGAPSPHDRHRTLVSGACDLCHSGSGRTPVFTYRSAGGLPGPIASNLSCTGCHGNDYGERSSTDNLPKSSGHGLRLHHRNAGVTSCQTCHNTDPTPFPESAVPVYFHRSEVIPKTPCNGDGLEDADASGRGLDNDGDMLYDAADPDCSASPCVSLASAVPPSSSICVGETLTLSDSGSSANCPGTGNLVYEWWQGKAGQVGSVQVGTGASYTTPVGLAVGPHDYDLLVYCDNDNTCRDSLDTLLRIDVFGLPGRIVPLLATKSTSLTDAVFAWSVEPDSGAYRVYSVAQKVDIPPRGSNPAATQRCSTPDSTTVSCSHAGAVPAPEPLLFYQVVGVCVAGTQEGEN